MRDCNTKPQQLPELPPSTRGQALHRLGFVLKRPQKRLLKADAAKRETFVKGDWTEHGHVHRDDPDVFFHDPTSFVTFSSQGLT